MSINWKNAIDNAVSTFFAALLIGAAAIVWRKTSTIDSSISANTKNLSDQNKVLKINQDKLIASSSELLAGQKALLEQIFELQAKEKSLNSQILSLQEVIKNKNNIPTGNPTNIPFILPKFEITEAQLNLLKEETTNKIESDIKSLKPDIQLLEKQALDKEIQKQINIEGKW